MNIGLECIGQPSCIFKKDTGAVEVAQWLRKALYVLAEDLTSGPVTHMVAHNHLTPVPEDAEPSSEPPHEPGVHVVYIHRGKH